MPATLSRIEPGLYAAIKSGDEAAFERLFRVSYYPLADEAMRYVHGDGNAAARAVESVFVQAWRARREIESAEALEAGLYDGVREAALIAESRHAMAHRLDELEGGHARTDATRPPPGVDAAWLAVDKALHADRNAMISAMHDAEIRLRHEAGEQLEEMAAPKLRLPLIITAAVLLIAFGGVGYLVTRTTEAERLATALAAPNVTSLSASAGELTNVSLPDGSKARLGPNSRVRIPAQFGANARGLELTGTASFIVEPGRKQLFVVQAGTTLITATGTEFAVRAYPNEELTAVLVRAGSVTVTAGDSTIDLRSGEALMIARDGSTRAPTAAELEESLGWTNGEFVIVERSLRSALAAIKHWYGSNILVTDTSLLNQIVTVRGAADSYESTLTALEKAAGVKRAWAGSNLVLRRARR